MTDVARCRICGEPMPPGEEMFKFHGYSGDCPKPPLTHFAPLGEDEIERIKIALMYQQMFLPSRMIRAVLAEAVPAPIGEDQSDLVDALFSALRDQGEETISGVIRWEGDSGNLAAAMHAAHISRTSASAGREWLPIESAPEDGTEIILWWPRHALDDEDNSTDEIVGGACAISSWVGGWYEPEYISGHGLHMDDDWCYAAEPTHWMPLPKAPVLALFPAPGKETT